MIEKCNYNDKPVSDHFGFTQGGRFVVCPNYSDDALVNPDMGIQTFRRFNGDPTESRNYWDEDGKTDFPPAVSRKNEKHPDSSMAYWRWYWARLEPERGKIRWDVIDKALEKAHSRGQTLHLRMMPNDELGILPKWYLEQGRLLRYPLPKLEENEKNKTIKATEGVIPDYNDPLFRDSMERLITGLGERYDGHPLLSAVDIGMGCWGEWHNAMHPDDPMLDGPGIKWAVDLYLNAFKKTRLIQLIYNPDALRYAVAHGAGWRADCWGDTNDYGLHHMRRAYPRKISLANANDAWKAAPVSLEVCWTCMFWHERGLDVDFIIEEALRWHVTSINLKSGQVPDVWTDKIEYLQKRMGYRYVLREAAFPPASSPGGIFELTHSWTNRGVAPCYYDYQVTVRLESGDRRHETRLCHDLKTWMPGNENYLTDSIYVPADFPKGPCNVSIGILRGSGEYQMTVRPANTPLDSDGFISLGELEIKA